MPIANRPPWLLEADRLLGTAEHVGPGSNVVILAWAKNFAPWVRAYFTDDDIPWCALFANECLRVAGQATTKEVLSAGSFRTYGQPCGPVLGALACFKRPGGHHVGFYLGQRLDGAILTRGGNVKNRAADTWINRDRLVLDGFRWPPGLPVPWPAPIILTGDGRTASTDEA